MAIFRFGLVSLIFLALAGCDDNGLQHRYLMEGCLKKCSDTDNIACIAACGQLAMNKCR